MSDRLIPAEMHGIQTPVVRTVTAQGVGTGLQGIGTSVILDSHTGTPRLAITIRHLDGDMVTALLDFEQVNALADMMAVFVEAALPLASEALH